MWMTAPTIYKFGFYFYIGSINFQEDFFVGRRIGVIGFIMVMMNKTGTVLMCIDRGGIGERPKVFYISLVEQISLKTSRCQSPHENFFHTAINSSFLLRVGNMCIGL